jgi:hypothetical protein
VIDYKATLRKLALRDDRYIESLLAEDRIGPPRRASRRALTRSSGSAR